jgi:hypothetical protein
MINLHFVSLPELEGRWLCCNLLAAQAFTVEGAQDEDVERIFEDSL